MSTVFFQSHEITIYRQRRKGSLNRFGMSATFTTYPADIQPASKERIQMTNGRFGKTYQAFIDANIDIKESDQIVTTNDNRRFSVAGVSKWSGTGLLDHIELIIIAQD